MCIFPSCTFFILDAFTYTNLQADNGLEGRATNGDGWGNVCPNNTEFRFVSWSRAGLPRGFWHQSQHPAESQSTHHDTAESMWTCLCGARSAHFLPQGDPQVSCMGFSPSTFHRRLDGTWKVHMLTVLKGTEVSTGPPIKSQDLMPEHLTQQNRNKTVLSVARI